ncbi:MAG: ABC transporter substrate-binding protein [Chloroflexi bacterium]|nr:ABC transporter substrate-binding protein [Chloroflexota bacterium]
MTVKVAAQNRPDQAPFELALRRGYFDQQGLAIDVVVLQDPSQLLTSLATNQVQVMWSSVSAALFNALNRGIDIRMVADFTHTANSADDKVLSLMVRKDLYDSGAVTKVTDLKGRPVSLGPIKGIVSDYLWAKALEKAGATGMQADLKVLALPDIPTALASKQIDAGVMIEPTVTQQISLGAAAVLVAGGSVLPGVQNSTLNYSPDFAKQQDTATKFMVALLQGIRDYNAAFVQHKDQAATIQLLTQTLSLKDPAVWQAATPLAIDPNGQMNVQSIQEQAQFYAQEGTLAGAVPDVSKYVDTQFATAAVAKLGKA